MMSRLAVYPLLGSAVLFCGRRRIGRTHFFTGLALALLPLLSLSWSSSPIGGLPFALRWFSFGLMVTGFSGSVNTYGLEPHLKGLAAAAFVTSLLMVFFGADTLTGNPNRTGMILALGFTLSLVFLRKNLWYSWVFPPVILAGVLVSSFITAWIACLLGASFLLVSRRRQLNLRLLVFFLLAGQILFTILPNAAGRIGPTLELRSRIWRYSTVLFMENLPLGTGTGSARLKIFTSAEPELQELAGENRRVDYLHSEPLTLITENGIPGLLLVAFILYWLLKKTRTPCQGALFLTFWPVFFADLPLATPLGALPAALFLASIPGLSDRKLNLHPAIPIAAAALSLLWGYRMVTGYEILGRGTSTGAELTVASERIPWEERVFLAAGYTHLREGSTLSAVHSSERFIELYPGYYRGWELRAMSLAAAGRECSSEWARAAALFPRELPGNERLLFVLNGIDMGYMDPDTAVILADLFNIPHREGISSVSEFMSAEEKTICAEKLLCLSSACMEQSPLLAAKCWFSALAFAADAGTDLPAETALRLIRSSGVYIHLHEDAHEKALDMVRELGAERAPPPE